METIGILIELQNAEAAHATLKRIETSVNSLGKKRTQIRLDDGNLVAIDDRIKEIQDRLVALSAAKKVGVITDEEVAEAKRLNAELKLLKQGLRDGTQGAKSFKQEFQSIQSVIAHVGSGMQSLGNALTRLSSPFTRLTTGLLMGAGYKALNMLTSGFSGAFERADTMKNYPRMLKEFGFSAEEASAAVSELEQAVLGLPTGLDEIVAVQKRFLAASQDMEKSTGLAIAFNNAILASGSDARQQLTAQRIITQLAGGADIATTSWQALQRAIPLVFTQLARDAKMGVGDYVKALSSGEIATEDFMKKFIEIGGEGSIAAAARVMTKSWEGLTANITNATKRMGTSILDTLHEVFKGQTGRDLLDTLLGIDAEGNRTYDGIRDWIDGLSKSVQNWIKSNPEKILEFFDTLKSIDWKGLLKGMAEGIGDLIRLLEWITEMAGDKDLSKFGKRMIMFGALGRGLTILGGIIKGLRGPLALLFAGALRIKGKGLFGRIASLFGKKKDITTAGELGGAISTAAPRLVSAFKNMALLSGIIAMPFATAWVVTKATKSAVKNFKDTIALLKDIEWEDAKKVLLGMGAALSAVVGISGLIGEFGIGAGVTIMFGEVIAGLITSIATGFFDLDMALIKGGIKNFVDSVNLLKQIPDVSGIGDVKSNILNAVNVLNEIDEALNGKYVGQGVKEGGIQGVGLLTGWNLGRVATALQNLKKVTDEVGNLANVSIPEGAVENISDAVTAIGDIGSTLRKGFTGFGTGNAASNVEKLLSGLKAVNESVKEVNKLGKKKISDNAVEGIKNIIAQLKNAFAATAVGKLRTTITAFATSIQEALAEIEALGRLITIEATVKLSSDFDSSVQNTVEKIKAANRAIRRAMNGIQTNYSKIITLNLNAKVNGRSAISGGVNSAVNNMLPSNIPSIPKSRGGLIYRARGGNVPFRRRGTDTVPAMLTSGEFVHNRQAVSTFGIDFMRKVNNLDIKGAMNELMHRAGGMANVNRGTVINNNNYNNQRVTINNNSPTGAGYTFKSASRFVGAF